MRRLLISILTIPLLTSCFTDKDSFCNKYDSEKNQVVELIIDSLNNNGGQIAQNYFTLGRLENNVKTFQKNLKSSFKHDYTKTSDGTCRAMLRVLDKLESEKYLRPTETGQIISYIPILTFDKFGRLKFIEAEIKYNNGKIDTVTDANSVDFKELIDLEKLRTFQKERDNKLTVQEKENERKRLEQERIDKLQEEEKAQKQREELKVLINNSISAKRLCKQYRENEIRADKAYLNKVITINGTVSSVDKQFGEISINLEGDDFIATVSCVTTDENGASRLQKGQLVVIEGTCAGIDEITKTLVTIRNSKILAY